MQKVYKPVLIDNAWKNTQSNTIVTETQYVYIYLTNKRKVQRNSNIQKIIFCAESFVVTHLYTLHSV